MKKSIFTCISICFFNLLLAQKSARYTNNYGDQHICGPFQIEELENDKKFSKWFLKKYKDFDAIPIERNWSKLLKNYEVEVYLGTWCGDSKKWVPRFLKMWDEIGLDRSQLNFTALYDSYDGKYKQGPNGEEIGKNIHRVPTFIFKKEGKEVARIVESPINSLETDLAQIALGYPSKPNYRAAARIYELLDSQSSKEMMKNNEIINEVYDLVKGYRELNTMGHVFLESNRIDEALMVFYFNTLYFKYQPIVFESYADALLKSGQKKKAVMQYKKVLALDKNNKTAKTQLERLD